MYCSYLAKPFRLCMLLEAECREVDARTEYPGLGQNTYTTNAVNLHLHVWVAIGITEVGQMRPPGGILSISFDDDSILVESVSQCKCRLRFLPRIQIVWLFSTKPVRQRSPDI
jgi:hypothetical protein